MSLQQEIFNQYYSAYPKSTLRSIAERTGMSISRVFRLINGHEMKLKEYEKLREAVCSEQKKPFENDERLERQNVLQEITH